MSHGSYKNSTIKSERRAGTVTKKAATAVNYFEYFSPTPHAGPLTAAADSESEAVSEAETKSKSWAKTTGRMPGNAGQLLPGHKYRRTQSILATAYSHVAPNCQIISIHEY